MTPANISAAHAGGRAVSARGIAFPERLRALMGANRITLARLGAECGVTPQAVKKWCDGEAMPSAKALLAISRFAGCSIEWLMDPSPMDWHSAEHAPQGRHAKYWVREAIVELQQQGLIA
jgi:transcriptional regulator with XRE-family HTH domain